MTNLRLTDHPVVIIFNIVINMKRQMKVLAVLALIAMLVVVSGCTDQEQNVEEGTVEASADKEATIGYVL